MSYREMLSTDSSDNTTPFVYFDNNRWRRGSNKLGYQGSTSNIGASSDNIHFLSADNSLCYGNSHRNNGILYQPQPYSSPTVAASGLSCPQGAHEYNSTTTFSNLYARGTYSGSEAGSNSQEPTIDYKRGSPPSCAHQQRGVSSQQQLHLQGNAHTELQPFPGFVSFQLAPGPTNARSMLDTSITSNFQPCLGGVSTPATHQYNSVNPSSSPSTQITTFSSMSSGQMLSSDSRDNPTACAYLNTQYEHHRNNDDLLYQSQPYSNITAAWDAERISPASCALQHLEARPRPQQQLQEHVYTDMKPLRFSPNHIKTGSPGLRQSPEGNMFHPYGRLSTSTVHPHNSSGSLPSPPCQSDTCTSGTTSSLMTFPYFTDTRYPSGDYRSSTVHDSLSRFMQGSSRSANYSSDFSAILTACDTEPVQSSSRRPVSRNNSSMWIARGKDNCIVTLSNGDMWAKFHAHTNEMIVTKNGRRMFPVLHFKISGLDPEKKYRVLVDMILADDSHWKFQGGKWVQCGNADSLPAGGQTYEHPDSPNTGAFWCKQEVSFGKLKLTNNKATTHKQMILNSMHRYQPRIQVIECQGQQGDELICHAFEDTQFIAVTAYQNTDITDLKVKYNPYARGMQDKNRSSTDAIFSSSGHHQLNFLGEPPLNQYAC